MHGHARDGGDMGGIPLVRKLIKRLLEWIESVWLPD